MKKLILTAAAVALLPAMPAMAAGAAATAAAVAKTAVTKAATNAARAAATRAVSRATGTAVTTPAATAPAATAPAVIKPAVAATTTVPAAAAKPLFSVSDSTIGALLDNPAAKAVLEKYVPAMVGNPQIDMARSMTLPQIQGMAGGLLNDETLAKIATDLAGIK